MTNIICLDEKYSTTRLVAQEKPEIVNNPEDKFETALFLPEGEGRKGEGGLRTKGYFKKSYENKPLISIITVVYNGEKYLEETIRSVINQTYDNIEYIIIDGGSTDGTLDIIKKYEDKIDYWVSENDKGIYDAWNKALRVAKGEWISFVGADDFLYPDAIQKYVDFIPFAGVGVEYISAKAELIDENFDILRIIGKAWNWGVFRRFMNVTHVGSLHHRNFFEKYDLFDDSYKIAGDYELLLRAGKDLRAAFIDEIVVRMINAGVSNKLRNETLGETMKAKLKNGSRGRLMCFADMYLAVAKKKIREVLS